MKMARTMMFEPLKLPDKQMSNLSLQLVDS